MEFEREFNPDLYSEPGSFLKTRSLVYFFPTGNIFQFHGYIEWELK